MSARPAGRGQRLVNIREFDRRRWIDRGGNREIVEGKWWTAGGSKSRPPRCDRGALPTDLAAHRRTLILARPTCTLWRSAHVCRRLCCYTRHHPRSSSSSVILDVEFSQTHRHSHRRG